MTIFSKLLFLCRIIVTACMKYMTHSTCRCHNKSVGMDPCKVVAAKSYRWSQYSTDGAKIQALQSATLLQHIKHTDSNKNKM